jgi:predicted sugar kinase
LKHEEFAQRARRRLEAVANRLADEAGGFGIDGGEASGTRARAQEMRVAALLVREEAEAVSKAEEERLASGVAPLEAQAQR